jgi:hypothetical protein
MLRNRSNSADQHYSLVSLVPGIDVDALVGLKEKVIGLKNRLISIYNAIIPGTFQEASAWRALSSELGSDDPLTWVIDSRMNSNNQHHITEHYQRRV